MSIRITNHGLDACASVHASPEPGGNREPNFFAWIVFTGIGTGTTPPAQTDTALAAELMRTQSNGGFGHTTANLRDAAGNFLQYTFTSTRVFNFTAAHNLTEFAHFTHSTGANAVFRDLFRQTPNDPASPAVVISVISGDQLQLTRVLVLRANWQAVSHTFTITGTAGNNGAGAHTGTHTLFAVADTDVVPTLRAIWPGDAVHGSMHALTGTPSPARDISVSSDERATMQAAAYTAGSFAWTIFATLSTAQANRSIPGFMVSRTGGTGTQNHGYKFILSNPASLTKVNTHTLRLDFRMTWSRL